MTLRNHEIKILTATTSTLRTLTSATMTGLPSRAYAAPTSKSRTRAQKTIQTTCIQTTTHTSEWTTQNYWHIKRSPSLRQCSGSNLERMPQTLGTSLPTLSTFITSTVYTFVISVWVSSPSKSNSKDTHKFAHFSIPQEMRSIVMKKTVWQFSKSMVTRIQFTVKIWPFCLSSFSTTKICTKIWAFSCSMCFARFKITSTISQDTSLKYE